MNIFTLLLQNMYKAVLAIMGKTIAQKILGQTDVDEKALAEIGRLGDKAKEALAKAQSKEYRKALAIGAVVGAAIGGVAGFLLKAWVF
jgi:hypothetical protein